MKAFTRGPICEIEVLRKRTQTSVKQSALTWIQIPYDTVYCVLLTQTFSRTKETFKEPLTV